MFLINPLEYLLQFDFAPYLFGAFAFFGVIAAIQMLIFGRGV